MHENPCAKEDPKYRHKIVVQLEYLTELDKIKVVAAERLVYRGLLPAAQRIKVNEMLEEFKRERQEQDAREKMESDLYIEMMEEQGVTQHDRINKSLDQYQALGHDSEHLGRSFLNILDEMKVKQMKASVQHHDRFT